MKSLFRTRSSAAIRSLLLLGALLATAVGLGAWKAASAQNAEAAAANQPEPAEVVSSAVATERVHRGATTAIGTVVATRSVTLRNELAGTVQSVRLVPGQVVGAGEVLVALDVSVEQAELRALQAQADLAATTLERVQRMHERRAMSAIELDNARAERDVALAQIARTRAIIARKTLRAPFRARVGIADVHPGQYLDAGTVLTTLQGVDAAVHIDFSVAQSVAEGLRAGGEVEVYADADETTPIRARIAALDSRVDPATRNSRIRARIDSGGAALSPGASVRVRVPVGEAQYAVAVPISALRKGPGGDHVFVLESGDNGETRARIRRVETGPVLGAEVVILSGLRAGEQIATSGSFKLHDGSLVMAESGAGAAVAHADGAR